MSSSTDCPGQRGSLLTIVLIASVTLVGAIYGRSEPKSASPEVTEDIALKAIIIFRESDPYSEDAYGAGAVVTQFTDKTHDVKVTISKRALPFAKSKTLSEKEFRILLLAFIVGDVNSQLLTGKRVDDSYAGVLQIIETYQRMRRSHRQLFSEGIEKLIELKNKGELKAYLSS